MDPRPAHRLQLLQRHLNGGGGGGEAGFLRLAHCRCEGGAASCSFARLQAPSSCAVTLGTLPDAQLNWA